MAFWNWIVAHPFLVGGAVSAALDLVFALVPKWESNGVLHFVYVVAKKYSGPKPASIEVK